MNILVTPLIEGKKEIEAELETVRLTLAVTLTQPFRVMCANVRESEQSSLAKYADKLRFAPIEANGDA